MEDLEREVETTLELSTTCKVLAFIVSFFLRFSPLVIFLIFVVLEKFLFAFAGLIVMFLITGILTSKIRITSLDLPSSEVGYKTYDLVKIFLSKNYC